MFKYRKKPVVIEAFQFTYDRAVGRLNVPDWFITALNNDIASVYYVEKIRGTESCSIKTLEGIMIAGPGDYIIRGVKGEIYPCKEDIFEMTYEKAIDIEDEFEVLAR